jgi:PAS domain S-box-containing protein
MGKRWSIYEPSQREWSEDAETYLVDFPEIQAIKMVYSDLSSAWVFPEKETESIKNMQLELNADFKVTLEATLKSDNAALSKPIDLPQSSQKGIITAYNLKKNGLNIGFIFIIYRMDMLMNSLLRDDDFNKVKIFEQGKAIFPLPSTPKKATAYFSKLKTIQVGTQSWEIAIEQEPNLSSGVAIGVAIGVGGCLLSLFCGLGIYLAKIAKLHQLLANKALISLQQETNEREKKQKEILQLAERLRLSMAMSPMGMSVFDCHWVIVDCNQAFASMLGYEPHEMIGRNIYDITSPENVELDLETKAALESQTIKTFRRQNRFRHRESYLVWGIMNATPIRDESGQIEAFYAQVQDINELKVMTPPAELVV